MEARLNEAVERIEVLMQRMTHSDERVKELNKTIEKNKQVQRLKLNFSTAKKTTNDQNKLADKLATTSEEVTTIAQQIQKINNKLTAVESTVLETKPDSEALARIEKDHGQLQKTTSETVKLNLVINQLIMKLQTVEVELIRVKNEKKKIPKVKLKKSDLGNNLKKIKNS